MRNRSCNGGLGCVTMRVSPNSSAGTPAGQSIDLLVQRNDFRIVRSEDPTLDLEDGAVGIVGWLVLSTCCVERGEVMFDDRDFEVIWSEVFDPDAQRLIQCILGLAVAALPEQQGTEYGEITCRCGRVQPRRYLA